MVDGKDHFQKIAREEAELPIGKQWVLTDEGSDGQLQEELLPLLEAEKENLALCRGRSGEVFFGREDEK